MPERVTRIANEVSALTKSKLESVANVATSTKILAINASVEAARAGSDGAGFAIVAREVGSVAETVRELSDELNKELAPLVQELTELGEVLVRSVRGGRLADLALNAIELIDRNLYERSCDVRWWATDSAVVEACEDPTSEHRAFVCKRLGVILSSYTVYLDLWVTDAQGNVIANGRPDEFGSAIGTSAAGEDWFRRAIATRDGSDYVARDVAPNPTLGGATVATYATAVRRGGEERGEVIGTLGIFFDFAPQAEAIVKGIRISDADRDRTRVMLVDSDHRVLASSDERGLLSEHIDLSGASGHQNGFYIRPSGEVVGYAVTPGYETYEGLGWYGVIVQQPVVE
ncbi:MAG TPA: methyl-accepting chemotaxis protein [Solirubrobacteraceae bacterium]|jgi:hypothetical protein|nr:methyl-accepting chemotaxis protein [Solirubrobacteraceae bacterium]